MQTDEITVSLVIYDYENLSELSELLNLKPSVALSKNTASNDKTFVPRNIWQFDSNLSIHTTVEEHLNALLEALAPSADKIAGVAKKYKTVISVGARYADSNPVIELEPAIIARLNQLGIKLWFDIYPVANHYLRSQENIEQFANKLTELKAIKSLKTADHDEAMALSNILAKLEAMTDDLNLILGNSVDEFGSIKSCEDEFESLIRKLRSLLRASHDSHYINNIG